MDSLVRRHDLFQRLEFGFVVGKLSHNQLLRKKIFFGFFRFGIGTVEREVDGNGDLAFYSAFDSGDFIAARLFGFDQFTNDKSATGRRNDTTRGLFPARC